ncbi:unnamed protein product [Allacma fusca]|uniref:Uncharacterized protein n=1 Tax=Allacma fusca TaxID=39272 RepID=A0A8J2PLZ9_9HEXA|nr:unnamed protein product [Allacma fusca]
MSTELPRASKPDPTKQREKRYPPFLPLFTVNLMHRLLLPIWLTFTPLVTNRFFYVCTNLGCESTPTIPTLNIQ